MHPMDWDSSENCTFDFPSLALLTLCVSQDRLADPIMTLILGTLDAYTYFTLVCLLTNNLASARAVLVAMSAHTPPLLII